MYLYSAVSLRAPKVMFFANDMIKGVGWVGREWKSHCWVPWKLTGVRARVRVAGKELVNGRQTDKQMIRPL